VCATRSVPCIVNSKAQDTPRGFLVEDETARKPIGNTSDPRPLQDVANGSSLRPDMDDLAVVTALQEMSSSPHRMMAKPVSSRCFDLNNQRVRDSLSRIARPAAESAGTESHMTTSASVDSNAVSETDTSDIWAAPTAQQHDGSGRRGAAAPSTRGGSVDSGAGGVVATALVTVPSPGKLQRSSAERKRGRQQGRRAGKAAEGASTVTGSDAGEDESGGSGDERERKQAATLAAAVAASHALIAAGGDGGAMAAAGKGLDASEALAEVDCESDHGTGESGEDGNESTSAAAKAPGDAKGKPTRRSSQPWTVEEDTALHHAVLRLGAKRWSAIATEVSATPIAAECHLVPSDCPLSLRRSVPLSATDDT